MAIDTAAKRSSVQAYTLGLVRPPPDSTVGAGDRATVAWHYSGFDYQDEVVDIDPSPIRGMVLQFARMLG